MNAAQYAAYEVAVAAFLKSNNVKPGCCSPAGGQADSNETETPCEAEPFFSWRPCECCGSRLGGDRETYQFAQEDGALFEADICVDCVYYLAYGVLDDCTMLEVDAAQPARAAATPESDGAK